MASARHTVPKGTFDVLPGESILRAEIEDLARKLASEFGYGRIETPVFEGTELFSRGVGESTDIVQKEMFSFDDLGGRSMTLRPEGTASVCRAYVEHGMHKLPQPVKLWYQGPFFRYEAPQAGRYRQFNQIGAEALGSDSPMVDAEAIILLDSLLRGLGVDGLTLRLASLGSSEARVAYREDLSAHLRSHESELSDEVRGRIDQNPLRAFDSDHEGTVAVMADAPRMLDRLEGADAEHFAEIQRLLDDAGVSYTLDGTLVRGLDYYTRTVFEFDCDRLGAQSGIGGGGRYDGLITELGGPATPGVGWAAGVERILLALDREGEEPRPVVFVVADEQRREEGFGLVVRLRRAGVRAELDLAGRSAKGQMKQANRVGANYAVLLEGDAARMRDMSSGEQSELRGGSLVHEVLDAVNGDS